MRGDSCEYFGRNIKKKAQWAVLVAILSFSVGSRFCELLVLIVFLSDFDGPIEHKIGRRIE